VTQQSLATVSSQINKDSYNHGHIGREG